MVFKECANSGEVVSQDLSYSVSTMYFSRSLEIKTSGLESTIGDILIKIHGNIALCMTSGNGGHWDVCLNLFLT